MFLLLRPYQRQILALAPGEKTTRKVSKLHRLPEIVFQHI
jgi:hypothetical protein